MGLKIQDLSKPKDQKKKGKRLGRGIGSGKGKTSGRGHKGAKARSGSKFYAGFEGGQMPLIRRVPKRGFTNIHKKKWSIINTGTLQSMDAIKDGAIVDKELLVKNGAVRKKAWPLKILGKGTITKNVTVKADAFTASAEKAIKAAGGKTQLMQGVKK